MNSGESVPNNSNPGAEGDLCNTRLGEFLLLRRLGSGGMADVYLAEQTSLSRSVAVKVLKADTVSDSSGVMLKRFEQEARAAGGLNHPHIVQIITTGRDGSHSYIVQEYVPGLNLSQWIKKHGSPDYGTGLAWMRQIANALGAASAAGIVHRDIKPENIMLTRSNVAKVTDFGLAQLAQNTDQKMNLTQVGTTMGTPWYMSPEQIQGEKLDHRSDQYSFGITCFHMFAGRPPFPGKNAVSVAVQHLKEQPPALCELRADLPKPLCDIIHRMMQKKATQRFQSIDELELELAKLEKIPVNSILGRHNSFLDRFRRILPHWSVLSSCAVALMAGSFAFARQVYEPIVLPAIPEKAGIPLQESAAAQFAVALLNDRNEHAWQVVASAFPETREADMARLRLGILYLNSPIPRYEKAMAEFTAVEAASKTPEKKYLQALGLIGQAYVLNAQGKKEEASGALAQAEAQYVFDGDRGEGEFEAALEEGPLELREFYRRANGGPFGFGRPPLP